MAILLVSLCTAVGQASQGCWDYSITLTTKNIDYKKFSIYGYKQKNTRTKHCAGD